MRDKEQSAAPASSLWKRRLHRGLAFCAAWICILCLDVFPAAAQADEKTVAVVEDGSTIKIAATPEEPAFWEKPAMSAGQKRLQPGTLRLVNNSSKSVDFELSEIVLPYDNVEALTYLDDLWITIKEGDAVLYDNTYSRIAGEDGLSIKMEKWAPGSERVLSIWMECPFTYDGGNPSEILEGGIAWDFRLDYTETVVTEPSSTPSEVSQGPVKQEDMAQLILYIAIGLIGVCLVAGIVSVVVRQLKKKKS